MELVRFGVLGGPENFKIAVNPSAFWSLRFLKCADLSAQQERFTKRPCCMDDISLQSGFLDELIIPWHEWRKIRVCYAINYSRFRADDGGKILRVHDARIF